MIYYIIFSYLFLIGIKLENINMPIWNILLAPIVLPILIGQWFTRKY